MSSLKLIDRLRHQRVTARHARLLRAAAEMRRPQLRLRVSDDTGDESRMLSACRLRDINARKSPVLPRE